MTMTSLKRLGAFALLATIALGACSPGAATTGPSVEATAEATTAPTEAASEAPALSGTVTIDGSSTVYPITEAVAEEFQLANPGVRVPTSLSGTGGGFKKFCAGETDINDASRPIKAQDEKEGLACAANGIEYVELQVAIDGLTVVVNPANTFATCLTIEELARIYGPDSPQDLKWSDVRAGFPADPVNRFMPGADSGTFDYFTEVINGKSKRSRSDYAASEDDNVLVQGVAGEKGGLGYFGFSYYEENQDKLRAVQIKNPKTGNCVAPSAAAAQNGTYKPLARPLFVYAKGTSFKRPEVQAFLRYIFDNEVAIAKRARFVSLTPAQLKKARITFDLAVKAANR